MGIAFQIHGLNTWVSTHATSEPKVGASHILDIGVKTNSAASASMRAHHLQYICLPSLSPPRWQQVSAAAHFERPLAWARQGDPSLSGHLSVRHLRLEKRWAHVSLSARHWQPMHQRLGTHTCHFLYNFLCTFTLCSCSSQLFSPGPHSLAFPRPSPQPAYFLSYTFWHEPPSYILCACHWLTL